MHEFSVMEGVVRAILAEATARDAKAVGAVELDVGALTFLAPAQLGFAYEVLAKGTVLEGSHLEVKSVEPEVKCHSCGYTGNISYSDEPIFHTSVPILSCPDCGGEIEILRGRECTVRNVKMTVGGDD